jgi:hypothetical protein
VDRARVVSERARPAVGIAPTLYADGRAVGIDFFFFFAIFIFCDFFLLR